MYELNNDYLDDGTIPGDKVLILKSLECKSTLAVGGVCYQILLIVQGDDDEYSWSGTVCAGQYISLSGGEKFSDIAYIELIAESTSLGRYPVNDSGEKSFSYGEGNHRSDYTLTYDVKLLPKQ